MRIYPRESKSLFLREKLNT